MNKAACSTTRCVLLITQDRSLAGSIPSELDAVDAPSFVTCIVATLREGLDQLARVSIDAVLLDAYEDEQLEHGLWDLTEVAPQTPVLVLSHAVDEKRALAIVGAGAQDVIDPSTVSGRHLAWSILRAIERHKVVTRLSDAVQDLKVNQVNLHNVINSNADGIIVLDRNGRILFVNPAAEDLFGRGAKQLVGEEFGFPLVEKTATEIEIIHKNVTVKNAEMRLVHLEWEGEPAYLVSLRDVTEQKIALERIRLQSAALEAAANSIVITDVKGHIQWTNRAFTKLTGYTQEDTLGATPRVLKSGHQDRAFYRVLWETVLSGQVWQGELVNRRKDGSLYNEEMTITPVRDRQGKISHFIAIKQDVAERRKLEEQLRQSQKLEAVGRLAGGVAHDFNNLLTSIMGYSQMLLYDLGEDNAKRNDLEAIMKAAERASSLTRQLLAFSRKQMFQPKVIDLNEVVSNTNKLLNRLIGEDINLVMALDDSLGQVKVDPGQIDQVIMNLAVNARDAMPEGGKMVIETANIALDETCSRGHFSVPSGRYVMLAVSDNGSGMDEETQQQIFEPFFTTKELGKGTGLGLATVYGIIKQSGGYVWVYSEPEKGSTFKIYLPRVDEEVEQQHPVDRSQTAARGSETILLVEDEVSVRCLARRILEMNGYSVLEAFNGVDALKVAERHCGPIHIMLTDVVMPVMGGNELARQLTQVRPDTKILFFSGYTDRAVLDHGNLETGSAFLQKPFTAGKLAQKVREILDGTSLCLEPETHTGHREAPVS